MKCIKRSNFLLFLVLPVFAVFLACVTTQQEAVVVEEVQAAETPRENVWSMLSRGNQQARDFFIGEFDVNATDFQGRTPLHYAAELDDAPLATFFIARGAKVDAEDDSGQTPLGVCAEKNSLNAAQAIVNAGSDIHKPAKGGISPAEMALDNRVSFLQAILTPASIGSTNRNGKTILHLASDQGNVAAVKTILAASGSVVNQKDDDGQNPLDIALSRPDSRAHMEVAEQLILSGAVSNIRLYNYFSPAAKSANYDMRSTEGFALFHLAAREGYEGLIGFLIEKKADVNIKNSSGETPLHEAVRSGNSKIIGLIIQNGADVNAQDAKGNSALHIAAPVREHAAVIRSLLENGANPNLRDEYGDSPLHVLVILNRGPEIVRVLLANDNIDVSVRNMRGQTPLFVAVQENRTALIPLLLSGGSDIFAADNSGVTPFDRALQVKGAVLDALITSTTAKQTDSAGNTILHAALQNNSDAVIVGKILDRNANVNARNRGGDTALHIAARKNQRNVGEYLLSRGADIFSSNSSGEMPLYIALTHPEGALRWMFNDKTVTAHDGLGNTVLHYAAQWKMDALLPFIIEHGASIEAANATGETPLFWAVKYDSASTARVLLRAKANGNARDTRGNSPLHAAVNWNAKNAATTLLDEGVDVNAYSLNGTTPLHEAVRLRNAEIAAILINRGANLEVRDSGGNTPFMEAVRAGNIEAINLLARSGADPSTRNITGDTPLHIAVTMGNTQVIQTLLDRGASIHARNTRNQTPFQIALNSSSAIVSVLLTANRVNTPDDFGNSPLHIAIEEKAPAATLQIIIDKGTRLTSVDSNGRIPLRLALDKDNWELVKILADAGSDPFSTAVDNKTSAEIAIGKGDDAIRAIFSGSAINAKDGAGNTILHYAARMGKPEVITLLLELGANKAVKNIASESPADIAVRWNRNDNVVLLN